MYGCGVVCGDVQWTFPLWAHHIERGLSFYYGDVHCIIIYTCLYDSVSHKQLQLVYPCPQTHSQVFSFLAFQCIEKLGMDLRCEAILIIAGTLGTLLQSVQTRERLLFCVSRGCTLMGVSTSV